MAAQKWPAAFEHTHAIPSHIAFTIMLKFVKCKEVTIKKCQLSVMNIDNYNRNSLL